MKLESWEGVGPVDVAVCNENGQALAFFELKCGGGTLFNCTWDLAKMAQTVQQGRVPHAFLVAAAPAATWAGADGSEFFQTRVFGTWTDVLERHRRYWEFWRKDHRPQERG